MAKKPAARSGNNHEGYPLASRLMDALPEDAAPEEAERVAKAALDHCLDCPQAWLVLGSLAEGAEQAEECFRNGIDHGRERVREFLEDPAGGPDLWAHMEARPWLRLHDELGATLLDQDRIEEALAVYQELLRLSPQDHLGARENALRLALLVERLGDARQVVEQYRDDSLIAMTFGRPLVAILEAVEKNPTSAAFTGADSPQAAARLLGKEYAQARRELKAALKANPLVPMFIFHPNLLRIDAPDLVTMGGPYEAFYYAREWGPFWVSYPEATALMMTCSPPGALAMPEHPHHANELRELVSDLENAEGPPWWELDGTGDLPK
jgi:tetratricopeptide (TPR) repeat protein